MDYKNSEMKIDQLIGYLNEDKINLSPAFQRGHVWNLPLRRKLLRNVLDGKPIPAIFLYKEASGAKYSYNILDGKQRIESIILYIANTRDDLAVTHWQKYFLVGGKERKMASFSYDENDAGKAFGRLSDPVVRDFREYSLPTIEIALTDDTDASLSEIISLFIDINQQGVGVKRWNIVKALCLDSKVLKSVFALIAQKQRRGKDQFYKLINNDITRVTKKLRDVQAIQDPNFKVDKLWEHILELALFSETQTHRKPIDITKGFINKKEFSNITISKLATNRLKSAFKLLNSVSGRSEGSSPFFSDYAFFYTIATHLTLPGVLTTQGEPQLKAKLINLANALTHKAKDQTPAVRNFATLSKQHATDQSVRERRETALQTILKGPKANILKQKSNKAAA